MLVRRVRGVEFHTVDSPERKEQRRRAECFEDLLDALDEARSKIYDATWADYEKMGAPCERYKSAADASVAFIDAAIAKARTRGDEG